MKKIYVTLLACVFCMSGSAQQNFTLEQCRQMALQHNMALRTAKTNIDMAEEQKKEAFTKYFPTVSATGLGFNANRDLININLSGMSLGLVKNGVLGTVSAVQPVFAGGQIVNSNKLAATGLEASKIQLTQSTNDVKLTAEQYYWNVVLLQEKLRTIDIIRKQLASMDKDVSASVEAGVTNRNDLLQVQLHENDVDSKKVKAENGLRISRMLLAQYIGLGDGASCGALSSIDLEKMPEFPVSIKQNHDEALAHTTEYELLQKNVEVKQLERKIEVGKNMPKVGIGAGYSYNDIMGSGSNRGMVFATLSVPISDWWGGSHAIKRKKLAEQNAREQLADNGQLLKIRMENDWSEIENAYKQLQLAKKSIEQADENLRLNSDFYHAGTSTMTDLMQAQSQYQQARDSFVDAYVALQLKQTEYIQATGK